MARLRNIMNKEDCLKKLANEKFDRKTISFYKFVDIENPAELRDQLFAVWDAIGVLGRIYVSEEGINAQLNVPFPNLKAFRASVDLIPEFKGVEFKYALEEPGLSFWKLTIKVRKHIVAHGIEEKIDMAKTGKHLNAEEWNKAIEDGAIVVDMRNGYESAIGHFEKAITPEVDTFREEVPEVLESLKDKKEEKILLYCTGGIRCEPISAYMKQKGFKDVNQLQGGIIKYADTIKKKKLENKFHGYNYVFDGRTAEKVTDEVLTNCYHCEQPAATHVNCKNSVCHVLFIQCKGCQEKMNTCCSEDCLKIAAMSPEEQKEYRKGKKARFLIHRAEGPKKATA